MPTNLPPEYYDVEERYRAAQTTAEKVAALEEMISTVPKHKGTDKLRADLRRRLSKLKESAQSQKGVAKQISPYHLDREGAGQVVVAGPPNVGKSSLVAALTNATPEVAPFPFSTWGPTPGMMPFENIQIQLIDTPPLNREFVEPDMLDLIRRADLLLLVVDLQTLPLEQLEESRAYLLDHRIVPGQGLAGQAVERRMRLVPTLVAVNKTDDETLEEDFAVLCELMGDEWTFLPVSATTGRYLERLKQRIFDKLEIIRVYSKPPAKEPDLSAPFVLPQGGTVEAFAAKVHKDFAEKLKTARVWGQDVYDGQLVGRDHILHDGDVVELRI